MPMLFRSRHRNYIAVGSGKVVDCNNYDSSKTFKLAEGIVDSLQGNITLEGLERWCIYRNNRGKLYLVFQDKAYPYEDFI